MSTVDIALKIAVAAHKGQVDRDDEAYILHPLAVGLMGKTDEERCTGFLHDVLEDTDYTVEMLEEAGIPDGVINALELLTHDKDTLYYDYVQHIIDSHNPIALRVKYNDLQHNYERGKAYPDLQEKHGKALKMIKAAIEEMNRVTPYEPKENCETAVFAAGCFWGVQHYFQRKNGVLNTYVGYIGGEEEYPTYDEVRAHHTHHIEAILVEYNPEEVSYSDLCKLFFEIHDPAQTDGQGPDKGSQYRSAVFYKDEEQLAITNELIGILREKGYEVNTLVKPATRFWIAEGYHQNYYENTGGSPYCHVRRRKF
ncbi:MAG: peptide-methionine (S)-S-oxide reductase MsrA [Bacteroidaceae bacterium]|nr:peptide-methionine (S)-S-oxide reductase MsrA [Bacteroidaceae bacterium]